MEPEVRSVPRTRAAVVFPYLGYLLLAGVLGLVTAILTSHGGNISAWWPAAGLAVLAVLVVPRRYYLWAAAGVWLVTGLSNYLAGRPIPLSLAFGLSNAAEALLVAWLLTRDRRRPALENLRDVGRLMAATLAGATLIGVMAGASVALLADGEFVSTVFSVIASHGSALLAIVPVAIAGAGRREPGDRLHRVAQPIVLAVVVLLVFWPGNQLPLAFVPMPFLVWGTFYFGTRAVAVELLAVATAVTTLSSLGGGPFVGAGDVGELPRVGLVQSFLVTYAASILFLSASRNERLRLSERLAEREQLLRGGILDAQVGLVIMRETAGRSVQIVQSNARAADLLAPTIPLVSEHPDDDSEAPLIDFGAAGPSTPLITAIRAARHAEDGEWYDEFAVGEGGERQVELLIIRVPQPHGGALLTAQVIDVTERHRADVAMRRALEDERRAAEHLRDLNRQKDDFVSAVSHELRTPITSIVGFVELLQDDGELATEQEEYLAVIDRNARRLSTLVEDLLALGAGAARRSDPDGVVDLLPLCADTVEELSQYAAERGVDLVLTTHHQAHARGDRNDVARILTNLVTNAVKFTPRDGSVTVELAVREAECVLTVTDTGVGIAPDELDKVFDRFYRSAKAEEDSVPGAGLGLALVRELVERNDGAIELWSDGAHGTRATVRLPVAQASDGVAQASDGVAQASDGAAQASDGAAQASDGVADPSVGTARSAT